MKFGSSGTTEFTYLVEISEIHMAFIDQVLQEPSYGWRNANGELSVPTRGQLFAEAFRRINVFRSRKNWLAFTGWLMVASMVPFLVAFIGWHFSWPLFGAAVIYSLMVMGTHGTIWYHRYCTHHAYKFSHPFFRILTQHLVIKTIPEEMYVVSHHVHHARSDEPGDPYNARGGFWYCMLADVNHQGVSKTLNENDYNRVAKFMRHTGASLNTYSQYLKWGTISTPAYIFTVWLINWTIWYSVLYLIGGHGLATALFSAAMLWFIFVRAFNYTGHGKGEEKHVEGIDFDRSNLSINQNRPGWFAGEWHNNHHLYPGSARCGFLPYQLDVPWLYIRMLHRLGGVSSYHDSTKEFMKKYGASCVKKAS